MKLVSFNTAVLGKEIGFDEFCNDVYIDYLQDTEYSKKGVFLSKDSILKGCNSFSYSNEYYKVISAPQQTILQKWLREKHLLHIEIYGFVSGDEETRQYYHCIRNMKKYSDLTDDSETFDEYEDCLEDGLLTALNLIKNN